MSIMSNSDDYLFEEDYVVSPYTPPWSKSETGWDEFDDFSEWVHSKYLNEVDKHSTESIIYVAKLYELCSDCFQAGVDAVLANQMTNGSLEETIHNIDERLKALEQINETQFEGTLNFYNQKFFEAGKNQNIQLEFNFTPSDFDYTQDLG